MSVLYRMLVGRLNTGNSDTWYEEMSAALANQNADSLVLDCNGLDYISSSGLRKLLSLEKSGVHVSCINLSPAVYEVFEVTGFTQVLDIQRKPRPLEIDDSALMARGTVGLVYRLDEDRVLKVFNRNITLDLVQQERRYAQKALMAGIPTAISYDIVQVKDCYGIIFEMVRSETFSKRLRENMDSFDALADGYADLLKLVHHADMGTGELASAKEIYHRYIDRATYLSDEEKAGLHGLVDSVPDRNTALHGDFHANNVIFQDGEMVLIDLGDISQGHPVFDLASMYVSHVLVGGYQPAFIQAGMGIDCDTCLRLWNHTLRRYFAGVSETALQRSEDLIRQFAYVKLAVMYVIAPGLENYLTWQPLEDARRVLFPRIETVRAALQRDDLC